MMKYNGIGQVAISVYTEDTSLGKAVSLVDSGVMIPGESGGEFHGVCIHVKNSLGTVAVSGAVTVPYTGTAPSVGYGALVCDGSGGVMTGTSVVERLVLHVDTDNKTVTFML